MNASDGLFDAYRNRVQPEWIDYNEHLNMGYYVVVFDLATDAWLDYIGLGEEHKKTHGVMTFTLESHVNYLRELRNGDPLRFSTQLLAFDEKRIHYIHQMFHADEGFVAATNELMSLHVTEAARRAAPIEASIQRRLGEILAVHRTIEPAPQVGRRIGLRNKST
ncbi:MAG: thioesterase family protein [Myxococcota bacterium]